jgi:hypothetical protein
MPRQDRGSDEHDPGIEDMRRAIDVVGPSARE